MAATFQKSTIREYAESIVIAVILALFVRTWVVQAFKIPTGSMENNLLIGDHLLVNKFVFSPTRSSIERAVLPVRDIRRGDIVVFKFPDQPDRDLIKRVIGLPGDTVEVRNGRLVLNGKPVKAEKRPPAMVPVDANVPCGIEFSGFQVIEADGGAYCRLPIVRETLPNGVTYDTIDLENESSGNRYAPVRVPAGHVFLMGDNRDRSADSRFSLGPPENGLGGPVPWENIGGRAEFITFSLDGSSEVFNPVSWFQALRGGRAGTSLRGQKE